MLRIVNIVLFVVVVVSICLINIDTHHSETSEDSEEVSNTEEVAVDLKELYGLEKASTE